MVKEKVRVKVIEDSEDLAYLVNSILEEDEGLEVELVTRNFDRLLSREPWAGCDVALVDFMLPGITGYDILRYLHGELPDIRRVLFTAVSSVEQRVSDYADCVVYKPASARTIREAIYGAQRGG